MTDQTKYSLGCGGMESLTHCWKNAKRYNQFRSKTAYLFKLSTDLPYDSDCALSYGQR